MKNNITINHTRRDERIPSTVALSATVSGIENPEFDWSSSDSEILSVSNKGEVRTLKEGKAVVTVTEKKSGLATECAFWCRDLPSHDPALMKKYTLEIIRGIQKKEREPTPEAVKALNPSIIKEAEEIAQKEYRETGMWFYARTESIGFVEGWDDTSSICVYGKLLEKYSLEELPNYSEKNLQKAREYWLGWQNEETGLYINPRYYDPRNIGDDLTPHFRLNVPIRKGIKAVYRALDIIPRYSEYTAMSIDDEHFHEMWNMLDIRPDGIYLQESAGQYANYLNVMYDFGHTELKAITEAFTSCLMAKIRPESGYTLIDDFDQYGTNEPGFKILGRTIGYHGLENAPHLKKLTDLLIKHQDDYLWGDTQRPEQGNIRNMIEMCVFSLIYHDYRSDEVMKVAENLARSIGFFEKDDFFYRGYRLYTGRIAGTLLNWSDFPEEEYTFIGPEERWGLCNRHRLVTCPYGHWINIEEKEPWEVIDHPDYSYEKYGMKTRNRELQKRRIHRLSQNIEPDGWYYLAEPPLYESSFHATLSPEGMHFGSPDFSGSEVWLKQSLNLIGTESIQNPYCCIKFKGTFSLYINGVLIKDLPVEMPQKEWDWCGFYIDKEMRRSLRDGLNIISVHFSSWEPDSFITAGLIDWK